MVTTIDDDAWLDAHATLARRVGMDTRELPSWGHRAIGAVLLCRHLAEEMDRHAPFSPARRAIAREYARGYRLLTDALSRCGALSSGPRRPLDPARVTFAAQ